MKKLFLFGALVSVGFSSCTKDYAEINTDPNNLPDVPATNLLAGVIKSTVLTTQFDIGYEMAGPWAQTHSIV